MKRVALTTILSMAPLLVLAGAYGYRGYVPVNGSFERYDAEGLPLGWNIGTDPGTVGNATCVLVEDSWKGSKALYLGSGGDAG